MGQERCRDAVQPLLLIATGIICLLLCVFSANAPYGYAEYVVVGPAPRSSNGRLRVEVFEEALRPAWNGTYRTGTTIQVEGELAHFLLKDGGHTAEAFNLCGGFERLRSFGIVIAALWAVAEFVSFCFFIIILRPGARRWIYFKDLLLGGLATAYTATLFFFYDGPSVCEDTPAFADLPNAKFGPAPFMGLGGVLLHLFAFAYTFVMALQETDQPKPPARGSSTRGNRSRILTTTVAPPIVERSQRLRGGAVRTLYGVALRAGNAQKSGVAADSDAAMAALLEGAWVDGALGRGLYFFTSQDAAEAERNGIGGSFVVVEARVSLGKVNTKLGSERKATTQEQLNALGFDSVLLGGGGPAHTAGSSRYVIFTADQVEKIGIAAPLVKPSSVTVAPPRPTRSNSSGFFDSMLPPPRPILRSDSSIGSGSLSEPFFLTSATQPLSDVELMSDPNSPNIMNRERRVTFSFAGTEDVL